MHPTFLVVFRPVRKGSSRARLADLTDLSISICRPGLELPTQKGVKTAMLLYGKAGNAFRLFSYSRTANGKVYVLLIISVNFRCNFN